MDSHLSVSKGVFVYKNGMKAARGNSKSKKVQPKVDSSHLSDSLWYKTFCSLWDNIESQIQTLNSEMFATILENLTNYVRNSHRNQVYEIPAAALLTGINMPDHTAQFKTLSRVFQQEVSPHVATLNSEDCQNIKNLVENLLKQIIKSESLSDDENDSSSAVLKKTHCNFNYLQSWYEDLYSITQTEGGSSKKQKTKTNPKLIIVIMSDFESFNPLVLQDFILIVSTYINVLPFVFVFGVATSAAALHRSLPYKVSSKVSIKVFNSSPSTACLNNVLEKVLFSIDCPFHLGGKVFNLFTDIFLFYDLSVSGFIQSFKYAMLEHFSYGNAMSLCSTQNIKKTITNFTHEDLENVRRLLSFRKLVESEIPENQLQLLTDDDYFRTALHEEIEEILKYLQSFHVFLNVLTILVKDLPKAPLGTQVREMYGVAVSTNICQTPEFKECFQLLGFQSKDELCGKITNIVDFVRNNPVQSKIIRREISKFAEQLEEYTEKINNLNAESIPAEAPDAHQDFICTQMDRLKLKMTLLEKSKKAKPLNQYEQLRVKLIKFLELAIDNYLSEPTTFAFHEIFFFNDISIQNHIVGSHRAAIHSALTDPQTYLQCSCCEIPNDSVILRSMPDISIAYKLHLECGKMINLYDWLQAFLSIIDPNEEDSKMIVDPQLQARFTQAVAELEFLGFIKSSKRKTDHVTRLTWGG